MSTPAPPRHPGGVHPTRRQLDELETLIQHMLTLPVNPADNSTPGSGNAQPAPGVADKVPANNGSPPRAQTAGTPGELSLTNDRASWAGSSSSQDSSLVMAIGTVVESRPQAEGLPVRETLPSGKRLVSPSYMDGDISSESAVPPLASASIQAAVLSMTEVNESSESSIPADPRRITTFLWGTLVWPNRVFDGCMMYLGRPGRWLSGRGGRALIGWTGLVLLAGAVAWGVLGWFGWTW